MGFEDNIHGVDDTVRVATGFIMGGFTAVYFGFGYIGIALIAAGIVFTELVFGFLTVMYRAYKASNSRDTDSDTND